MKDVFSKLRQELSHPTVVDPDLVARMREVAHEFNDKLYEHNLFLYLEFMPQFSVYRYMAISAGYPRSTLILTLRDYVGRLVLDQDQLLEGCSLFDDDHDDLTIRDVAHLNVALDTCFDHPQILRLMSNIARWAPPGPIQVQNNTVTSEQVRDLMNGKDIPFHADNGMLPWGDLQLVVEDSSASIDTKGNAGRLLLL